MKHNKTKKTKTKTSHKIAPRKTRSQRGLTNEVIEQKVLELFLSEGDKVYNYKQIAARLFGETSMAQKRQIYSVLESLVVLGVLKEVEQGRFQASKKLGSPYATDTQDGVFHYTRGHATFTPDNGGETIELTEATSAHALDGDRVRISLHKAKGKHLQARYQVVKILERSERTYVGKLHKNRRGYFVTSEVRELRSPIDIPHQALGGAREGDRVIARILSWSSRDKQPIGEIVDTLGKAGSNNAEMHAILAEFGLPYEYPKAVEEAAEALSEKITAEALRTREDFRQVPTLTIDPKDAKDFDDALSLRKLPSGHWEVGVHIADVSHFVRPGDLIDEEAYQRATSVYLVDRTIPMLPERLCNLLCSLRPGEDKYSYSCVFEMDEEANILSHRIVRSLIHSDRRMTYEEAQDIITGIPDRDAETILTLSRLAQELRSRRFKAGSIAFERSEVRFEIDDEGRPLSVYLKESLEAHQLVEEFMLLANKAVAERIGRKRGNAKPKAFVYRIHDEPDRLKLEQLSGFAASLGYKFKLGTTAKTTNKQLNKFLSEVKDKPEGDKFSTIAIRTMAKAKYSSQNIGHYGLAFPYYTHFTSPIRRYPDLMVHRLLTYYLEEGGKSVDETTLEGQCEHCSARENLAAGAERASIRYKQVEYMSQYLGETVEGIISGIAEWGLYVETKDSKCEGLVPMRELNDDYYDYDERNYCLVGRHSKRRYALGDTIQIRVASANLERRQLDYSLAID